MSKPALSVELQVIKDKIIQDKQNAELERLRALRKGVLGITTPPGTKLSSQEESLLEIEAAKKYANFLAETEQLFIGREAWLKQKREALIRKNKRALTIAEEQAIELEVNNLLRAPDLLTNPQKGQFLANFKYESDDISEKLTQGQEKNGMQKGIQEMVSKMSTMFGEGPFAFFGKLLSQIFGALFSIMPFFKEMGESINPKKTPADLLKEGAYDQADSLLSAQELALIQKLEQVNPSSKAPAPANITSLVEKYKEGLTQMQRAAAFCDATDAYKKENLTARIQMFESINANAKVLLSAQQEHAVAKESRDILKEKEAALKRQKDTAVKRSDERKMLSERLVGVRKELETQKEKKATAKDTINTTSATALPTVETNMLNMFKNLVPSIQKEYQRQDLQHKANLANLKKQAKAKAK